MSSMRTTQQQVDEAYRRAGELLHRGVPPHGVKLVLERRGWSEAAADAIIADATAVLGLEQEPARLLRKTWMALAITALLATAGAGALVVASLVAPPEEQVRQKTADFALLILLGVVFFIGAAMANLVTLVTAVRARRRVRHPALGPLIVLCMGGVAATVYGGLLLAPFVRS